MAVTAIGVEIAAGAVFEGASSRPKKAPSRVPADVIVLIRRMATENTTWGAERIRGELLKLGIEVSKRTIQRHIQKTRPHGDGQRWSTFLKNHSVWACDFVQTYDCWFRPLFTFFIVDVNRKTVLHVGVTRSPSEAWTARGRPSVPDYGTNGQLFS